MKRNTLHPVLKQLLGHKQNESTKDILATWKRIASTICKPCWELKYCPFGPLVEQFPLLPPTRDEAEEHNQHLAKCLESGRLANGKPLDAKRRKWFREELASFDPFQYPEKIPEPLEMMSCRIFGHVCPVFLNAEPFTETTQTRRHGRYIPRDIMLKVVRRDGQMCQVCHKYVPDNQLDFDHVIPHSKGGPVTVENLRVVHAGCNREKGNSLDTILDPNPLSRHFLKKKEKKKRKASRTKPSSRRQGRRA